MTGRKGGRWLAGTAAVALAMTTAVPVQAATGELRATMPEWASVVDPLIVTDSVVVAEFGGAVHHSADAGITWSAANLPYLRTDGGRTWFHGEVGHHAEGVVPLWDDDQISLYTVQENTFTEVPVSGKFVVLAMGKRAVLEDEDSGDISLIPLVGGTAVQSLPRHADVVAMDADGSVVLRTGDDTGLFKPATGDEVELPLPEEMNDVDLRGGVLTYRSEAAACSVIVATAAKKCTALASRDSWALQRTDDGLLAVGDPSGDVTWWPASPGQPLGTPVTAKAVGKLYQPADTQSVGDPLVGTANDTSGELRRVRPGTISTLDIPAARRSVGTWSAALSPTTVLGASDSTPGKVSVWKRSVGSSIGAATTLTTAPGSLRATTLVSASAGRWAMTQGTSLTWYDKGAKKRTVTGLKDPEIRQLSGPYALVNGTAAGSSGAPKTFLVTSDGALSTSKALSVFGSLVIEETSKGQRVRDLTGRTGTVSFTAPRRWDTKLWGDWVVGYEYDSDTEAPTTVAYNFRTKAKKSLAGYRPGALGDGVVEVERNSVSKLWNFKTGAMTVLPNIAAGSPVALDGHRAVWLTPKELIVSTVTGSGGSAPRVLGTVAPGTFNPAKGELAMSIDLTKPTKAGVLKIRNSKKKVVREIPVPASPDGSLRLSWDGRGKTSTLVPNGSYTLELVVKASDGTGRAVRVDGKAGSLGSVKVATKTFSKKPKPTISGTPKVGKKLTVKAGSWSPRPTLSYQWYRNGTRIVGAQGSGYRVVGADAGKRISVKVTAKKAGYLTASKTSASTAKVRK